MPEFSYETIKIEREGPITTLTLNRPEKKNAMNPKMHHEMYEALGLLSEDEETRVLVLTGAGGSFCAGQDLKETFKDLHPTPVAARKVTKLITGWGEMLRLFPRPTIASVNGYTFGGGFRVMGLCDIAIASEKAIFGLSEVNFGIVPAAGATKVPVELLSHRDALYMILTAEPIDAATAEKWRLVNRVVPHEKLREETMALAAKLAKKPQYAVSWAKDVFWASKYMNYQQSVAWELAKNCELEKVSQGVWIKEGIQKFVDKKYRPGMESYTES